VPGIEIDRKRITSDEAIGARGAEDDRDMGSGAVGVEFASIFNRSAAT
jgi:hypothetical protein